MESFLNLIKISLWKSEDDFLKTAVGDRALMKLSFFTVLVCAFHKKPAELS